MTTASKITLSRVLMIPVYLVTMYLSHGQTGLWMYVSLAIFVAASLTDFVDGYIARHYHQVTDFGKFLDPLADKLLVIAAMCIGEARTYRVVSATQRMLGEKIDMVYDDHHVADMELGIHPA